MSIKLHDYMEDMRCKMESQESELIDLRNVNKKLMELLKLVAEDINQFEFDDECKFESLSRAKDLISKLECKKP